MASHESNNRIGELLLNSKLINREQLDHALTELKTTPGRLGSMLVRLGYISNEELTNFLSVQFGIPAVNLQDFSIPTEVVELITSELANKHHILPINRIGSTLIDR